MRTIGASRRPPWARACTAIAIRKKLPATKIVMNVDSLVAKLSASSAPNAAGCQRRGTSKKRNVTTSIAIVIAAM